MTKRNVIKGTRAVITGRNFVSSILIWKEGRSWKIETDFDSNDITEKSGIVLRYENNKDYTLKETASLIDSKFDEEYVAGVR